MEQLELVEPDLEAMARSNASMCDQISLLTKRNWRGVQRNPMQLHAKIGQQVFFAIMMVFVFSGVGFQNEGGLEDNVKADPVKEPMKFNQQLFAAAFQFFSAMSFLVINTIFNNAFNTLLVFIMERAVFLREQSNNLYSVFPFFISKNLVELPVVMLNPFLLTVICYFAFDMALSV